MELKAPTNLLTSLTLTMAAPSCSWSRGAPPCPTMRWIAHIASMCAAIHHRHLNVDVLNTAAHATIARVHGFWHPSTLKLPQKAISKSPSKCPHCQDWTNTSLMKCKWPWHRWTWTHPLGRSIWLDQTHPVMSFSKSTQQLAAIWIVLSVTALVLVASFRLRRCQLSRLHLLLAIGH